MKRVAKVAVSLPLDTLKSLEKARLRLKKTRSAVVTEALQRWLEVEQLGDEDKRYVEGYLKKPEISVEVEAVAAAVAAGWGKWQ
jgi:metal-responsive CopG/Arc/MetJ family transcriptional regulator